jgi:large subunit ribosomal protein L29
MRKTQEFREKSFDELVATLTEVRRELFQLTNEKKQTKQLDKPHTLRQKRKEIARIQTVLNEKRTVADNA